MTELGDLLKGEEFYVWDEGEKCGSTVSTVRLHSSRMFLTVKTNLEVKVIDCCRVRDVRRKVECGWVLLQMWLGSDLVNLSGVNMACNSEERIKKWWRCLCGVVFDPVVNNLCPQDIIVKQFMMLESIRTAEGVVDVRKIIRFFHGKMSEKSIRQVLSQEEVLKGNELCGEFDRELWRELMDKFVDRADIEEIFRKYSNGREWIDLESLVEFINETQRDSRLNTILFPLKTREECLEVIERFEKDPENIRKERLGVRGFGEYLSSNTAISAGNQVGKCEMSEPLCHYFINSSHNTYLVGRQFGGKSSAEIYRSILIAGCRCVELDCWDGKEDDEPIITHGLAACTEVLFRDVVKEISESAFITSDMPVILSFENHCSYKQQKKMVDYCISIFGDLLLKDSLEDYPLEEGVPLPSPATLRRKIIIKNKKTQKIVEDMDTEVKYSNSEAQDVAEVIKAYKRQHATTTVHPELSSVINYVHSVKFAGFQAAAERNYHFHISSFAENAGYGLIKNSAQDFVRHNKKQLTRIYPKGARFDSSNYLPQLFWNAGCQLVALNWQTAGPWMQLNQGKFEYHGNTGYILKPLCMRSPDQTLNPFTEATIDGIIAAQCSVTVISGQFLHDRKISTFVEVEMYGLPTDTIRKEFRTKVVHSNGMNPFYREDPFVFRKVVLPELAILKIAVYDWNSSKLIGQRHLPFELIENGYRYVVLRSEANTPLNLPTVLCHFELGTYIPHAHGDIADVLSDPTRFLSDAEKARKMLNNMGVEDNEIEEDYYQDLHLPTIDQLKQDTEYLLLHKRFLAELAAMKESFIKRRMSISKDQCDTFVKKISQGNHNKMAKFNDSQNYKWRAMVAQQENQVLQKNQEMCTALFNKLSKLARKSHQLFRKQLDRKLKCMLNQVTERHAKSVLHMDNLKHLPKAEKIRRRKEMQDERLKRFIHDRRHVEKERDHLEKYWSAAMASQIDQIQNDYDHKCLSLRLKKNTLDLEDSDHAYV